MTPEDALLYRVLRHGGLTKNVVEALMDRLASSGGSASVTPAPLRTFGVNGQGWVTVYRVHIQHNTFFTQRPGLHIYISDGPTTNAAEWQASDVVGGNGESPFLWAGPTGTYDVQLVDTTLGTSMANDAQPPAGYQAPTLSSGANFGPAHVALASDAAGTTLGTVVGKAQVLGEDGTVKGYVPIYDAIT